MPPTGAAAVAAAYAYIVGILWDRNFGFRQTYGAVINSARANASIGMLIDSALALDRVVSVEQIPEVVKSLMAGYDLSANWFLFWVNIILLVLGCVLEGTTIIL